MSCIFSSWPYRWYGFTHDKGFAVSSIPSFAEMVDTAWNPEDVPLLLRYLRQAPTCITTLMEAKKCSHCDVILDERGTWLWDNQWLWPSSLAHYLEAHSVRLPDQMMSDIRGVSYQVPIKDQLDIDKGVAVFDSLSALATAADNQ